MGRAPLRQDPPRADKVCTRTYIPVHERIQGGYDRQLQIAYDRRPVVVEPSPADESELTFHERSVPPGLPPARRAARKKRAQKANSGSHHTGSLPRPRNRCPCGRRLLFRGPPRLVGRSNASSSPRFRVVHAYVHAKRSTNRHRYAGAQPANGAAAHGADGAGRGARADEPRDRAGRVGSGAAGSWPAAGSSLVRRRHQLELLNLAEKNVQDIFSLLRETRARPSMYLGEDEAHRRQQLSNLEMMIFGYERALKAHDILEPGRTLWGDLCSYLRETRGWGTSVGPIGAILEHSLSPDEAWSTFWVLLERVPASTLSRPRSTEAVGRIERGDRARQII